MTTAPKTVLIVDDDAHIREVVRFALAKSGFRVVEAVDGRAALAAFAAGVDASGSRDPRHLDAGARRHGGLSRTAPHLARPDHLSSRR